MNLRYMLRPVGSRKSASSVPRLEARISSNTSCAASVARRTNCSDGSVLVRPASRVLGRLRTLPGDTTTQCKVACPRSWTKPLTCPCPSKRSGRSTCLSVLAGWDCALLSAPCLGRTGPLGPTAYLPSALAPQRLLCEICRWRGLRPPPLSQRPNRARPNCIFLTLMPHLLSQAEPHAARALTVFPTSPELAVSSQFRAILLRRLRLSLLVAPRACACRGRRPGRLCKRGRACFPRFAPRTGSRARLPRSWRSGSAERASGGHEHRCAGLRRPPHRSCCQWAPALAWFLNRPSMPCTIISPVTRAGEAQPGTDVRSGQA